MTRYRQPEKADVSLGPCMVLQARPKAIYCALYADSASMKANKLPKQHLWVPQSVVSDDSEVWKLNDQGDLIVKGWWAEAHGFA